MRENIEELLAEFIDRKESGESLGVEAFVSQHPEGGDELRRALADFAHVEDLFPSEDLLQENPEAIGPYRVVRDLGRGGMGRVFEVRHEERPDEALALKQLHPLIANAPRALERFRREGELLATIDHPGIVKVRAVQAVATPPFLVMDLVDGGSLASAVGAARDSKATRHVELPGPGNSFENIARFVASMARAVEAMHTKGLLHRDLKPANVIVDERGQPILIDFGLAVHEGSETVTASGDLLGTPHYMAPEQARGERADPRTDVYGLGAVLYELLTLRTPHPGREPLEVLHHIAHRPVASISQTNPAVPQTLRRITARAMAWKAGRRYATAGELAADLEAFLAGEPTSAKDLRVVESIENFVRFQPRAAALIGVLLLLALASPFAFNWLTREDKATELRLARQAANLAWIAEDDQALLAAAERLEACDETAARLAFVRSRVGGPAPPAGEDVAVDALYLGLEQLEEDDAQLALESFEQASAAAPEWVLPMVFLARASIETGDDDRGLRELTAAARFLPESIELAIELAKFHTDHENYLEALRVLDRALARAPEDWRLWYRHAKAHALSRDSEAALTSLVNAMQFNPESDRRVLNLYAATVDRLGDHERAREMLSELIAKYPDRSTYHFNMAYSLDLECKLVEARESYLRSLERNSAHLQSRIALAHIAAGSNREKCKACQVAFEATPELFDPDEAEALTIGAIEQDRCETSWLPDFSVGLTQRIGRTEAICAALRNVIEGEEVDERVVRVERALRKIEGR